MLLPVKKINLLKKINTIFSHVFFLTILLGRNPFLADINLVTMTVFFLAQYKLSNSTQHQINAKHFCLLMKLSISLGFLYINQFTDLSASSFKWLCCFLTLRVTIKTRKLSELDLPHLERDAGMLFMMKNSYSQNMIFSGIHQKHDLSLKKQKGMSSHGLRKE